MWTGAPSRTSCHHFRSSRGSGGSRCRVPKSSNWLLFTILESSWPPPNFTPILLLMRYMRSWWGSRRSRAKREARAINFRQKNTYVLDHFFFKILPVGQILPLYALVGSSLPHRNLLNSSLAADPPQRGANKNKTLRGKQKPFKINPRRLKMKSGFPWTSGISIENMQSNQTVSRKVDREGITIGSFLAHRFGLRIFARDVFSKRVRNMLATTCSFFGIFTKFEGVGVRNYEIGVWRCVSTWKMRYESI